MASTSSKKGTPIILIGIIIILVAAGSFVVYQRLAGLNVVMKNPLKMAEQKVVDTMMGKVTEEMFKDIQDPLLRQHFVKMYTDMGYRVTTVSDGRDEVTIMDMVRSGMELRTRTREQRNKTDVSDMVMIGTMVYVKDFSDNTWWVQDTKDAAPATTGEAGNGVQEFLENGVDDLKNTLGTMQYTALGQEACGDLTCYKYQEVDPANPEATRTFWFDTKELLLRRETNSFGEFTSTNAYEYGIRVDAPSPTKPVPAGQSIFFLQNPASGTNLDTMPSTEEINQYLQQMTDEQETNW